MEQIKGKLPDAEKIMLQKKNTNQSLKVYTKEEPKPAFINSELLPYYEQTDLSLIYVYECCKTLKPLKGIDINDMQVEFWYKEFIRMGWTKQIFMKRFEAIKRAVLYNRIDLENWMNSDILYSEDDFNVAVKRKIDTMIQRGNFLKDKKVELTEEEKTCVDLWASQDAELRYKREKAEAMEDRRNEKREIFYRRLTGG